MAVSVKDFLDLPLLDGAKLVAGAEGVPRREIRWIAVIEWPVETFVRPDEIVLTSGVGCDAAMFQQLVREIMESGAAGLCVGVGPGRFVEAIQPDIRRLGDERQFPLVELPWELRFADITKAVVTLIVQDEQVFRDDAEPIHTRFTRLVLEGQGVEVIAEALERQLRRPVLVLDADFQLEAWGPVAGETLGEAGIARCRQVAASLTGPAEREVGRALRLPAPRRCPGLPQLQLGAGLAVPVVARQRVLGYLYALEGPGSARELTGADAYALQQAAGAVALEILQLRAAAEGELRVSGDFAWAVALGHLAPPEDLARKASLLGHNPRGCFQVMLVSAGGAGAPAGGTPERDLDVGAVTDVLLRLARTRGVRVLCGAREGQVLALIEATRPEGSGPALARDLQRVLGERGQGRPAIGLASAARSLRELPLSYGEASHALEVGRVVLGPECVADARELRPFLMLRRLGDDEEARRLVLEIVGPLLEYDRRTGRGLVQTLMTYLEEAGNASAAARRLSLNRHSLLYRLQKIEALTGYAPCRYAQRFVLDLSLKLLRFQAFG